MIFPDKFFYDEVREGFYINGMVKREWAAQIEVLQEIDKLCKKHNIKWFADCGTLLGAVRHGGFVPWDDDLDICMLRDDYQKFQKYAEKELPDGFVILTYECEEYWQMITRVTNVSQISLDKDILEKYHQFPYAAGIDIFVLDYVASNEKEEEVRRDLVNSVLSIAARADIGEDKPSEEGIKLLAMVEETCGVKINIKDHIRRQLYQLAERLSCLYPSKGAKEVVLMPYWCSHHDHKYNINDFLEVVQIPFENTMINVPAGYDNALKVEYGDYLKICRGGGFHEYPLYELQEDFMFEKIEKPNVFRYVFDKEELTNDRDECPPRLKDQALDFCEMLGKVNQVLESISEEQVDSVLEVLEQCQEGAIRIGTQIEEQEGEGFITVKLLEEYCERLYKAGEALGEGMLPDVEGLEDNRNRLLVSIREDIHVRREILFLPYRADLWWTMEEAYEEMKADPLNHVVVMPLPFFDRDAIGNLTELHYDIDGYPDGLELTDYHDYDIRAKHPDMIYIQNAYDKYNYTSMLPPEYFTSKIKKYTEELIYIPPFRIGKFDPDDKKLYKTTLYFLKMPGVINADKVLLETEQMCELYRNVLTEFCGEDTRQIWEKKIQLNQMIKPKKSDLQECIPDDWRNILFKSNGELKKVVLFQNAVCSFYQNKDKALAKLEHVLQTFFDNREDVALIWRPHPSIAAFSSIFGYTMMEKYRGIIKKYREGAWGIFDDSDNPDLVINLADAYYGDPDPVMQRCRNMGKPVMILNMDV